MCLRVERVLATIFRNTLVVCVVVCGLLVLPAKAQWSLVGVTGDGASVPEALFEIDLDAARKRFIMDLGGGNDGESIAYNPVDGFLYHGSGNDGGRAFDRVDVSTRTVEDIGITGPTATNEEFTALAYDAAAGDFIVAVRGPNRLRRITLDGEESLNLEMSALIHGMGFLGDTLYGVSTNGDELLRTIDPATGAFPTETPMNVPGADSGFVGMAIHPETGVAYAVTRDAGRPARRLVQFDLTTGEGEDIGLLGDGFAGLAFIPTSELPADLPPFPVEAQINNASGEIVLFNPNDAPIPVKGYSVRSADGSLNETHFTPLADSDTNWVQLTAENAVSDASEGHLTTGALPSGGTSLGNVWQKYWLDESADGDMTFELIDDSGAVISQPVIFSGPFYEFLDLTYDGEINVDDWVDFKAELGVTDLTGLSTAQRYNASDLNDDGVHDILDVLQFRQVFDAANGAGAFAAMVAVPEPSTLSLVCLAGVLLVGASHWRAANKGCRAWRASSSGSFAIALFVAWQLVTPQTQAAPVFAENFDGLAPLLMPAADEDIPEDILGWTHTPPPGWMIDNISVAGIGDPNEGVEEWEGWSFTTLDFWTMADGQGRTGFLNAKGVFAVADPDEWDDLGNPEGIATFTSELISAAVDMRGVPAGQAILSFDSSWRDEETQQVFLEVSYDDGPAIELLHWTWDPNHPNFHDDALNEKIVIPLETTGNESNAEFVWRMFDAHNDWWWAIDNIEIIVPHTLRVNTETGELTLVGGSVSEIFSYEIKSEGNSLQGAAWAEGNLSTQDLGGGGGALEADFNNDNLVNGDDLLIWETSFGTAEGATPSEGDTDDDQDVDGTDFLRWQTQFGSTDGGVGPGEDWETLIAKDSQLLEAFLLGSTEFAQGTETPLGIGYNVATDARDLTFQFTTVDGTLIDGLIEYVGGNGAKPVPEPGTGILVAIFGIALLAVRRRSVARGANTLPVLGALLVSALLVQHAAADRSVDRDYRLGDTGGEGAFDGDEVGAGNGFGTTFDAAGVPNMQQLIDLDPFGGPEYVEITNRPDNGGGLGVRFVGSSQQYLSGPRLGRPETSVSSVTQPGGSLDYTGITDRGLQFWVNPASAAGPQTLVMDTNQHGARINAQGNFSMRYAGSDFDSLVAATPGEWRHVMVVRPGGQSARMYIDGIAVAAAGGGYDGGDTADLVVGANTAGDDQNFTGATEEFFSGIIDDLELFVLGANDSGDYGTFALAEDNGFVASTLAGRNLLDLNGDGSVSGNGRGPAQTDDVTAFVDGWLNANRINGELIGDLSTLTQGDFNLDGETNLADWAILNEANPALGAAVMGALSGVPEPTSAALAGLLGVFAWLAAGRRRQRG